MKAFLSSLAVVLVGFSLTYYVYRKAPDLRYQLSSPIPTGAGTQNVQQLEIANVGNAVAQRVQVQVRKKIGDVSVIKDSEADTYKQYPKGEGIEVVYDSLPPGGTVRMIFTFTGTSLGAGDLSIRHQEGVARAALASTPTPWYQIGLDSFLLLSMVLYLGSSFRHLSLAILLPDSRYQSMALIKRSKPVYLGEKEWQELRSQALTHAFERPPRYSVVTDWDGYVFLDSDAPTYLSDKEWQNLTKSLRDLLADWVKEELSRAYLGYDLDRIRTLLPTKKLRNVPESFWLEQHSAISVALIRTLLYTALMSNRSELSKALKEKPPVNVADYEWKGYIHRMVRLYLVEVILSESYDPSFSTDDSGVLAEELQTYTYKRTLYRLRLTTMPDVNTSEGAKALLETTRPAWMDESDYKILRDRAASIVAGDGNRAQYREFNALIQRILMGVDLPDTRPVEIAEEDWTNLCRIHDAAVNTAKANSERAARLSQGEMEVAMNRTKVLRQLEVIDTFLRDPSVLDRLEEYDKVFAPGNFANLKRLAELRREPDALS